MLHQEIIDILNKQIAIEAQSSHKYLALASWCDRKGFAGSAKFLFEHSDEERMHMLKLVNYVIDQGGEAVIPKLEQPRQDFSSIKEVIEHAYASEQKVTEAINRIVTLAQEKSDHTTHNFIQWYVEEQLEEENLYRTILDRIELIGEGGNSLYLIDVEIEKFCDGQTGMAVIEE